MSTTSLIVASMVCAARACSLLGVSQDHSEIVQCAVDLVTDPAMKGWAEGAFTEQRSDDGLVTYAYNWRCTREMMPPLSQYGRCICDYFMEFADQLDSTCKWLPELELRAAYSSTVSNIMATYCPGLNFDCNGAAPTFTMYSFQCSWTMDIATGTLVSFEAEIKYAVAESAGVRTHQVRVTFARRLSSAGSATHTVTATIDHVPTESAAASVQSRLRTNLKAKLETAVPHSTVSSVEVSQLTNTTVDMEQAFGTRFADSAHRHSLGLALLLAVAAWCCFVSI